jgi:2-phosphosulfolactate phosphatase
MMKLSMILYPEERDYTAQLRGKTVIVLDIIRATSSIVTAIAHRAAGIIPVRTIKEALEYKKNGVLLAGEENGLKPDGFDLGNSPREFRSPKIRGKWVVMRTHNGTQAIVLAAPAKHLLIGAFINATACARLAAKRQRDIVIFCSGTGGKFSLEDSIAAGCISSILAKQYNVTLDDTALLFAESYEFLKKSSFTLLWQSKAAKRIKEIGKWLDIGDCLKMDRYHIVPVVHNGVIKKS